MRALLIFIFAAAAVTCQAQTAVIIPKDGRHIEVQIASTTDSSLVTTKQQIIPFSQIKEVVFESEDPQHDKLYTLLQSKGIVVTVDKAPSLTGDELADIPHALTLSHDDDITLLKTSLEKYRIQSTAGKGIELLGLLSFGVALTVQQVYNNKYNEDFDYYLKTGKGTMPTAKTVPPAIYITSVGVACIGLAIDLGAGMHIKALKK